MSDSEIEKAVGNLLIGNQAQEFHHLESLIDVFCPFEAVGMVRQEIKHASYLSYILDPNRPHGLGTAPLREFLLQIASSASAESFPFTPLDVHFMQLDQARVRREWRSIDLLIELPDPVNSHLAGYVIVVELKIDATESRGQLCRYRKTIQEEYKADEGENAWSAAYIFLTAREDDPSVEDGEGWVPIGLSSLLDGWDSNTVVSKGSDLLKSYIKMIRRNILTDPELEELAQKVWSQHGPALDFLMQRRPDVISDIQKTIYDRRANIAKKLSDATGFQICVEDSKEWITRFAICNWDDLHGLKSGEGWLGTNRLIALEIMRFYKDQLRFVYVLGPGDNQVREAIFEKLKSKNLLTGSKTLPTNTTHKHLAAVYVLKTTQIAKFPEREVDVDAEVKKIENACIAHLRKTLKPYDKAIRSAVGAHNIHSL